MKEIEFGKNLKMLRTKNGLTRNALANMFSYSSKAVEKWEAGVSLPPLSVIAKLSEEFGVTFEELIYKKSDNVKYFLGIDGSTKTKFLLCNEKRETIAECELDLSNPIDVGMETCKHILSSGIDSVCHRIDKAEISLFAGLSGIESAQTESEIYNFLLSLGFKYLGVGNNIENVIDVSLGSDDGIAMICGTGIVAYVKKGKFRKKIAGNGFLFDNGGSAYDIGRDAFEASFRENDGRGEKTIITTLLTEMLGDAPQNCIDKIYKGGRRFIASASDIVFAALETGDTVAKRIIEKNTTAIADIINAGLGLFDKESVKVAICGMLCEKEDIILKYLKPLLPKSCELKFYYKSSVLGAVSLAEKLVTNIE